jgi:hypothetical protein
VVMKRTNIEAFVQALGPVATHVVR